MRGAPVWDPGPPLPWALPDSLPVPGSLLAPPASLTLHPNPSGALPLSDAVPRPLAPPPPRRGPPGAAGQAAQRGRVHRRASEDQVRLQPPGEDALPGAPGAGGPNPDLSTVSCQPLSRPAGAAARQHREPLLPGAAALPVRTPARGETTPPRPSRPSCSRRNRGSSSRGSEGVLIPAPTPRQIVEMSGGPQLASGVRRPHLTSEAVALLRENVTPSENALWTSLGDSWTRPG